MLYFQYISFSYINLSIDIFIKSFKTVLKVSVNQTTLNMGIIKSVFKKKESSGVVDIDIFEPDVNTERISDTDSQADEDVPTEDSSNDEVPYEDVPALSTIERIKVELECPVCHEIPIKLCTHPLLS